jgi:hypothetical protein
MAAFEVTPEGTVKAWYEVDGKLCFHLTDEGLIVDAFDASGDIIGTYAATPDEFFDWMMGE